MQVAAAGGEDEELAAVVVGAAGDGRGGRTEDFDAWGCEQGGGVGEQRVGGGGDGALGAHERQRREGRHAGGGAQLAFVAGEAVVAGVDERQQVWIVGIEGLYPDFARPFGTAGAAGNLHDQLRGALRGAVVGGEEASVGAEHRHQRHVRKVVSLGEHLRADQNRRPAGADRGQASVQAAGAAHGVAVDAVQGHVRMVFGQRLLGALRARADGAESIAAAVRAFGWHATAPAAMVAAQLSAHAVVDELRVAVAALRSPSALRTQQHWRVAAPVDQHERLAAGGQMAGDGVAQRVAEAAVETFAAGVHHAVGGHRRGAGAFRERGVAVALASGVLQRLQGRRGAAEHDRNGKQPGALDGHVARRVAQAVLLLEGCVVLFVDDHHAQVGERREHRRARADQDAMDAARALQPDVEPLRVRERGVQRGGGPEALPKARRGLRRQGDFRHQHQRLFAALQDFGDDAQIDLGLAAAGDAVEQVRGRRAQGLNDAVDGGRLRRAGRHAVVFAHAVARRDDVRPRQPLGAQGGEMAALEADACHVGVRNAPEFAQTRVGIALPRCSLQGVERVALRWLPDQFVEFRRRLAAPRRHRKHGREGLADGMVVVGGKPLRQRQKVGRQQGCGVENLGDRLQRMCRLAAMRGDHRH